MEPNVSNYLQSMEKQINDILDGYSMKLTELNKTLALKMNHFTASHQGMESDHKEMSRKVDQLQHDFSNKAEEVLKIQQALKHLEQSGRTEDSQKIVQLGQEAEQLHASLKAKAAEVKELQDALGSGAQDVEDLLNHITELEAYSVKLHKEYKVLSGKYKDLFDKSKAVTQISHVQHYGKFNLLEHLQRAKGRKRNAGDW